MKVAVTMEAYIPTESGDYSVRFEYWDGRYMALLTGLNSDNKPTSTAVPIDFIKAIACISDHQIQNLKEHWEKD